MASENKSPKITHVIFDADGLLFDTEPIYTDAINAVTRRYDRTYTYEIKRRVMGMKPLEASSYIIEQLHLPLTSLELLNQLEQEIPITRWHGVQLLPGVEKVVNHLHNHNIPMAVATGSSQPEFEAKCFNHSQLWTNFHHSVASGTDSEVLKGKPAPDIFFVSCRRFKIPPLSYENVLVFEDALNGVQAGLSAGMHVIWIPDSREKFGDPEIDITDDQRRRLRRLTSLAEFRPQDYGLPPFSDTT